MSNHFPYEGQMYEFLEDIHGTDDLAQCAPPEIYLLEDKLRDIEKEELAGKKEWVNEPGYVAYSVIANKIKDLDDVYEVYVRHNLHTTGDYDVLFHDNVNGETLSWIYEWIRRYNAANSAAVTTPIEEPPTPNLSVPDEIDVHFISSYDGVIETAKILQILEAAADAGYVPTGVATGQEPSNNDIVFTARSYPAPPEVVDKIQSVKEAWEEYLSRTETEDL